MRYLLLGLYPRTVYRKFRNIPSSNIVCNNGKMPKAWQKNLDHVKGREGLTPYVGHVGDSIPHLGDGGD